MQSGSVVESLDVIEDVAASLSSRTEREVIEPLSFDRMEEALGKGVVQAIAGAAHAAADAVAVEEILVVRATVLRSAVAVMNESRRWPTRSQGDPQGLKGQGVTDAIGGGPADDAPREDIDDDGEKEPALASTDLRDVGDPESIRPVGSKVPEHEVGSGREIASTGGNEAKAPRGLSAQAFQAHPARHAMPSCAVPSRTQRSIDSRRSVDATVLSMHGMDAFQQRRILSISLALWTVAPGVEAAAGDLEHAAELAYREGLPLLLDEAELHFCSSAK